jgi:hypothetical protein
MPGPQVGIGAAAVAAWWLASRWEGADESEAAAKPAKTMDTAKIRTASFIKMVPSLEKLVGAHDSLHLSRVAIVVL